MCADGIAGVVRGQGQQGYVEINACEQQQPTRWRWLWGSGLSGPQPPPDCSLGQEVEWMAARALATAPWILGIVVWALPLGRTQPGIGVLASVGTGTR